jgi:uncharacterized repeat protein (TIGR04138 family)
MRGRRTLCTVSLPSHFKEAKASLNQWRLRTSEDLGAIIFALTEAKLLRASEAIRQQDFAGRFTLATLFKSIDPM